KSDNELAQKGRKRLNTGRNQTQVERVFRERTDQFGESTEWLLSRYRFPKHILLEAIPVHIQLLSTLGFLATVLEAIISLSPSHIQFPYSIAKQAEIKQGFHAIAAFPNKIGAIDCTHIAIKGPSNKEFNYVNRKGFHSINVQIICDATLLLLNNSSVGVRHQETAVQDGWPIEDQGYPLKPWLMTPLANPRTHQEQNYNRAQAVCGGARTYKMFKITCPLVQQVKRFMGSYVPTKVCSKNVSVFMYCSSLHLLRSDTVCKAHTANSDVGEV
uniref:DDE Tnp4 domain-containing protein n=1 Tax=Labrus bergylta TaxID=56723 RepID=A0A3Q3E7W9_9LABR